MKDVLHLDYLRICSPELSNDFKETSYLSIQNEVSQPNLSENEPQKTLSGSLI